MAAPATTSGAAAYSVSGKTAIVTGAGSGIGLSFTEILLAKNCNVVIADIALRPEAQKVVDEYSAKEDGKARAIFLETDVADWDQLERMFSVAYEEFGGLDIVCPGAGIFEPHWSNFWVPPGTGEAKDARNGGRYATMDINVTHPIRTTQLAIENFLNPPSGEKVSPTNPKRIVHIASIAGQASSLPVPMYSASKHAIIGFVRSFPAMEEALGIRINGIAPGIAKTPLWTDHPEKTQMLDQSKDIWVTSEEVGEGLLQLVESAEYPSGTILEVGHEYSRIVPQFNNPGPSGAGTTASGFAVAYAEVFDWLSKPNWGKSS